MKTRQLVYWIAILAVFTMAARISVDTDTWWHLRAGKWILDMRAVPLVDPFSYTRLGADWRYPGWLVEVPMYWIFATLGPGGLNIWTALMVTAAFVLLWPTMAGGVFTRAFVLILAATVSGVYWAARPYLVTFLLTALFIRVLEDFQWARTDRLLWLPLLMVIWANSHGGFAVGFILLGVYLCGAGWDSFRDRVQEGKSIRKLPAAVLKDSRVRRLLFTGALMAAAVAVNPSGPTMLLYPFQTVSISSLRDFIQEWQSPNFHELQVQPFLWMLLAILGAVGVSKRRLALVDFLLVAGFAYLGFLAGRNIALFALVAPAVLTRYLAPNLEALSTRWKVQLFQGEESNLPRFKSRLNFGLVILLALAAALKSASVFPAAVNQAHFEETLPVGAARYLADERPVGRLMNSYNWGGYLLWALPEYPVFIDGRTDLYDDEIIEAWLLVMRGEEGWQTTLDEWGVNLVLVEPAVPVNHKLEAAGWQLVYGDRIAHIYQRPLALEEG